MAQEQQPIAWIYVGGVPTTPIFNQGDAAAALAAEKDVRYEEGAAPPAEERPAKAQLPAGESPMIGPPAPDEALVKQVGGPESQPLSIGGTVPAGFGTDYSGKFGQNIYARYDAADPRMTGTESAGETTGGGTSGGGRGWTDYGGRGGYGGGGGGGYAPSSFGPNDAMMAGGLNARNMQAGLRGYLGQSMPQMPGGGGGGFTPQSADQIEGQTYGIMGQVAEQVPGFQYGPPPAGPPPVGQGYRIEAPPDRGAGQYPPWPGAYQTRQAMQGAGQSGSDYQQGATAPPPPGPLPGRFQDMRTAATSRADQLRSAPLRRPRR